MNEQVPVSYVSTLTKTGVTPNTLYYWTLCVTVTAFFFDYFSIMGALHRVFRVSHFYSILAARSMIRVPMITVPPATADETSCGHRHRQQRVFPMPCNHEILVLSYQFNYMSTNSQYI